MGPGPDKYRTNVACVSRKYPEDTSDVMEDKRQLGKALVFLLVFICLLQNVVCFNTESSDTEYHHQRLLQNGGMYKDVGKIIYE